MNFYESMKYLAEFVSMTLLAFFFGKEKYEKDKANEELQKEKIKTDNLAAESAKKSDEMLEMEVKYDTEKEQNETKQQTKVSTNKKINNINQKINKMKDGDEETFTV